jgi:hypothetical protein
LETCIGWKFIPLAGYWLKLELHKINAQKKGSAEPLFRQMLIRLFYADVQTSSTLILKTPVNPVLQVLALRFSRFQW